MIIEETANVLREMKDKRDMKNLTRDLYEAVKTANLVKNNPKKHRIAKKLVSITEGKLMKQIRKVNENHQFEDESEMAKAQLLAIMEKAKELYQMIGDNVQLEDWVQYKLSIAENYMDAVHGYMKYFIGEEDMENNMQHDMEDDTEWDEVEEDEDFDDEFDTDFGDEEYYDVEDFDDDEDEYYDEDEDFEDEEDYFSPQR